jgi:hypothetical protein
MDIGGYEFEGVFTELEQLPSNAIGVYVVLCLIEGRPHCVLYIGTSEGGQGRHSGADITDDGNLQETLRSHEKSECWDEATHGGIGYCVKSVTESDRRIEIRNALQWQYVSPCGTDPWDVSAVETAELERQFGPRGSSSI